MTGTRERRLFVKQLHPDRFPPPFPCLHPSTTVGPTFRARGAFLELGKTKQTEAKTSYAKHQLSHGGASAHTVNATFVSHGMVLPHDQDMCRAR